MPRTIAEKADIIPKLAEVFRQFGYDGASLSQITNATGLGKGSLYHFFPGGKQDMGKAVLDHIDDWFNTHIFVPLETAKSPAGAIENMFNQCTTYFKSGQRVCLVGAFALEDTRDQFADQIQTYFVRWVRSLQLCLQRLGHSEPLAQSEASHIVASIQGAIILARSTDDTAHFHSVIQNCRKIASEHQPTN